MIELSVKQKQHLVSMLSVLLTELTDDGDRAFVQEQLNALETSDTLAEDVLIRLEKLFEPERKAKGKTEKKTEERKEEDRPGTDEPEAVENGKDLHHKLREQLVRYLRYLNMIRKRKNNRNQSIRKRR